MSRGANVAHPRSAVCLNAAEPLRGVGSAKQLLLIDWTRPVAHITVLWVGRGLCVCDVTVQRSAAQRSAGRRAV